MRKKGLEFNFAWLFAIIAGAVILFLAIYSVVNIVGTERYKLDTITAKQLSIIFEPMETGLASGKSSVADLRENTRIYDTCYADGYFGKQKISLATQSSIGKKWQEPGGEISIPNKYIFSGSMEEGKRVYLLSKSFEMPWKISEIIFLTTKQYCFVNAPEEIIDEVTGLNLGNVKVENCTGKETKVCFGSGNCEIKVIGSCISSDCESEYDYGVVSKEGASLYYAGSLIYGAIFSDKEIYNCNVKRLMKRLAEQANLYEQEANFLVGRCESSINLAQLQNFAIAVQKSQSNLNFAYVEAKSVNEENDASQCKLW